LIERRGILLSGESDRLVTHRPAEVPLARQRDASPLEGSGLLVRVRESS